METLDGWRAAGARFDFAGHGIFYRDAGAGPLLLVLHGFPTASWDFHAVWPGLVEHFRVVAADMLGFGFSDKPREHVYSLMEQADLQEALLGSLGARRVHVLAHDYGTSVAQELLARQAEGRLGFEIASVCLLNGGIIPGQHRPRLMQRLLHSPLGRFIGLLLNERGFARSFAPVFGPNSQPSRAELHDFWALVSFNDGHRIAHRLIRYMGERRRNYDRWVGILRDPGVRVRLIFGALDPVSGRHMAEEYRGLVAGADVVLLEEIGHYPQTEAPDRVLAAFLEFALK